MHANDETNNCSLVLRVYYNGHGILLTGDAESTIESGIMRTYKSGLNSTYIKIGHHGAHFHFRRIPVPRPPAGSNNLRRQG